MSPEQLNLIVTIWRLQEKPYAPRTVEALIKIYEKQYGKWEWN